MKQHDKQHGQSHQFAAVAADIGKFNTCFHPFKCGLGKYLNINLNSHASSTDATM